MTDGRTDTTYYRDETRPDTRHKMRLVCVLFTLENNTGRTDLRTDLWTDLRTDGRTDTTAPLKTHLKKIKRVMLEWIMCFIHLLSVFLLSVG